MAERIDVAAALDDLARHLPASDPDVDVVGTAVAAIAARPSPAARRRWWPAVAAAVLAVVVATAALPAGREAVADLLGIGGVRVRLTGGVPDGLGARLDLGRAVDADDLDELDGVGAPVAPAGIGDPAAAFAGRPPGGVTLVWAPTDELPEVLDTDVGLLLTTFPGDLDRALIEKRVLAGSTFETTSVDGAPAFFVAGAPHAFLYVGPDGEPAEDTVRLSGNALVWADGGVTYRLESSLPLAAALALAESIEPLDR